MEGLVLGRDWYLGGFGTWESWYLGGIGIFGFWYFWALAFCYSWTPGLGCFCILVLLGLVPFFGILDSGTFGFRHFCNLGLLGSGFFFGGASGTSISGTFGLLYLYIRVHLDSVFIRFGYQYDLGREALGTAIRQSVRISSFKFNWHASNSNLLKQ